MGFRFSICLPLTQPQLCQASTISQARKRIRLFLAKPMLVGRPVALYPVQALRCFFFVLMCAATLEGLPPTQPQFCQASTMSQARKRIQVSLAKPMLAGCPVALYPVQPLCCFFLVLMCAATLEGSQCRTYLWKRCSYQSKIGTQRSCGYFAIELYPKS